MNHFCRRAAGIAAAFLIVPVAAHGGTDSRWQLNGSVITLVADGPARAFRYHDPRAGARAVGVRRGTLLFSGTQLGATYTGTGYVFSARCGALPYPVTGEVVDGRRIRLFGSAPTVLDFDCRPLAFAHDVNEFTLLSGVAPPIELVSPPTLVARTIEREAARLADLTAFARAYESCRRYDQAACDVALASPMASATDAALVRGWRVVAGDFATAFGECRSGSRNACAAALASPALMSEQRALVETWQTAALPFAKASAFLAETFAELSQAIRHILTEMSQLPASPLFPTAVAAALALLLGRTMVRNRRKLALAPVRLQRWTTGDAMSQGEADNGSAADTAGLWSRLAREMAAPASVSAPAMTAAKPASVKEHDTPGALTALELALAYLEEVREAERPDADDEALRRHQLNTLALAVKQLERAERLDPDAVLEIADKDGASVRFSLTEIKAEALLLEGLTHRTYDTKRAIPALAKATTLNPADPRAFYLLGLTEAANHNKTAAVTALKSAVALDPTNLTYRKELDRAEAMTAAEIAAYKATRAGEKVFDAGVVTANAGIRVYNVGVILWNIFAFTYNVLTFPLRLVFRIALR